MFSNPRSNVAKMRITPGLVVADFGAGIGEYTKALAEFVGPSGKVTAIEVQRDLIKRLLDNVQSEGHKNVSCIWGDIEVENGTSLRSQTIDRVLLANVLFQVENREGLIGEVKRVLKPGAMLIVIDWEDSFGGMGPASDKVVNSRTAKELFESRGFSFEDQFDAGDHHYGLILKKI